MGPSAPRPAWCYFKGMRLRFTLAVVASFFFVTLASRAAFADKVAVLPFSTGNASKADLDAARASTREAAQSLAHKMPSASEMVTAEMAIRSTGPAPTSEQYRAAGRASTSDWTVSARVEAHGTTYRIEIEA